MIYNNRQPSPTVPCCDLCNPSLLDQTRPSPPSPTKKAGPLKVGLPNESVRTALEDWRNEIVFRDFGNNIFGASGILKDEVVERLASVGPILRLAELERVVGPQWPWFGKYGDELLTLLLGLSIPPMKPKPTKPRGAKRPLPDEGTSGTSQPEVEEGEPTRNVERTKKRARTGSMSSTHREKAPTTVNLPATPAGPCAQAQVHHSSTTPVAASYHPSLVNPAQPSPYPTQYPYLLHQPSLDQSYPPPSMHMPYSHLPYLQQMYHNTQAHSRVTAPLYSHPVPYYPPRTTYIPYPSEPGQ